MPETPSSDPTGSDPTGPNTTGSDPTGSDPSGPDTARPRQWRPTVARVARHVALPLVASIAIAAVISLGIEVIHVQSEPWMEPGERWASLPHSVLALGALAVWPFVGLILALTGSMWVTAAISLVTSGIVAFADHEKMVMRGEPLYPSDTVFLTDPGLLLATVGINPVLASVIGLLVLGAAGVGIVMAWRRRPRRSRSEKVLRWVFRGLLGATAVAGLVLVGGFNKPDNSLRDAYERAPTTWAQWNQTENYARNGFIAGVLYNLPGTAMAKPADYSQERMAELATTYSDLAREKNTQRDSAALDDTNVIVILSETFADPTQLDGLDLAEDPIPFTRSLMESTTSGWMLSSGYGGGTANVEFEVLTGMAMANFAPQMHAPFPMLVPHHETFPSFVDTLGEERETMTIHPYSPGFYRRDAVYPVLGFEHSLFWDTMSHTEKIEGDPHISDAATYTEVVDELQATRDPALINVVTMQNHSPYVESYSDPMPVTGAFDAEAGDEMGQYLRGLQHSDAAMAQFIADLEELDEDTIVLFYGDHHPAMWPNEVVSANSKQTLHETPWFVWANFDTEPDEPAPVLGSNHLLSELLATADAPMTPYNALLAELSEEVAGDEAGIMLDGQGQQITDEELSSRARELLEDYRLLQYDLAVGQRYSAAEMLSLPTP